MEFSKHFSPIDPHRADLTHLERHARELQEAFDAGNPGARSLVARHLPKRASDERLKLAYSQFVVARTHGFTVLVAPQSVCRGAAARRRAVTRRGAEI